MAHPSRKDAVRPGPDEQHTAALQEALPTHCRKTCQDAARQGLQKICPPRRRAWRAQHGPLHARVAGDLGPRMPARRKLAIAQKARSGAYNSLYVDILISIKPDKQKLYNPAVSFAILGPQGCPPAA